MFGFGPRYATSDAVTFKKDTVLKKVDPRFMEVEVKITQAAYDLARTSGLFYVPQIIRYDRSSGVIEFERVCGYITLGQLLARTDGDLEIIRRVGRVLAHIHDHLNMPPDLRHPVGSKWLSIDGDVVPMHGDFNTVNVGYKEDTDVIVVLDWASAPSLGARCTTGPRYLELAHFIYSLLIQQANFLKSIGQLRRRTNAFLEGYQAESGQRIDLSILAEFLISFSIALFPVHTKHKNLLKRLYYTGICSVGYIIFKSLAKQWRQAGQFTAGKRASFHDRVRNV